VSYIKNKATKTEKQLYLRCFVSATLKSCHFTHFLMDFQKYAGKETQNESHRREKRPKYPVSLHVLPPEMRLVNLCAKSAVCASSAAEPRAE
jgi:hypothetical protein